MKKLLFTILCLLLISACAPKPATTPTLTVMTHDSFAVSEHIIAQFEADNNVKVVFLKSGDTGAALNKAILSKEAPLADVFYGVDNTFLSRALQADIFEAYAAAQLANIPAEFKLDANNRALPVDFGDVCINYDKSWFAEQGLEIPQSLEDLTLPQYKGLLVVENPATSSPGLAFLLATIAHFGETGYLDYWQALKDNGAVVVGDWSTAYYTNFSGSAGMGAQPMVVSYSSSPAAEVYFAETPPAEAPTASIMGTQTCFRQVEFVGILKGTVNRQLAEKFIDFMLGKTFQEDMPLQMFVYPVNPAASLPQVFSAHASTTAEPATIDPAYIAEQRESWIEAWKALMLP